MKYESKIVRRTAKAERKLAKAEAKLRKAEAKLESRKVKLAMAKKIYEVTLAEAKQHGELDPELSLATSES